MSGPRARSPRWGKDAAKYLLPDEPPVVATRRHPAVLVRPFSRGIPVLFLGGLLLSVAEDVRLIAIVGLVLVLGALTYLGLHAAEWWVRHFLVTRRRVLLTSGVIIRTVAVMPVRRITDLTWKETFWGQLLGYGTFRFESAGQAQGLDVITFVPHADAMYRRLSELMFGKDTAGGPVSRDEDADGSVEADGRERGDAPERQAPRPLPSGRGQDTAPIPRYRDR
ncbi:PH domain-containing protein [Modestobacter sp. I12A-02662]|uniref:PH domain-containing protein n=1 Tax=Modestobacter sp. I12A-02662 TaxID=1730496 RepID=UPI0034DF8FC4